MTRVHLVEKPEQYVFAHKVIMSYVTEQVGADDTKSSGFFA